MSGALPHDQGHALVRARRRFAETHDPAFVTGFTLCVLPRRYAICRLHADTPFPGWLPAKGFVACTRSARELSIVCDEAVVPDDVTAARGWRGFAVDGTLDFDLVGVLASLTTPLAAAGVSVFAVSTYETDFLFVRAGQFDAAVAALDRAGHFVKT